MQSKFMTSACALAAAALFADADAQAQAPTQQIESVVVTGKRANRISKGATGLPMALKDTPQTISTLDKEDMADFGLTGSNEALQLATGINVEQYETNRATFNSRGFEIQLTQVDGVGMSNDWGTVVGRQDTYLFERIELIRGANGLLTGVGNASGTINYVRKRPTNTDGGQVGFSAGSYGLKRAELDYNKVFSSDGAWAGRVVVAHEDKDSYLRALHDKRTTLYGVVDGQIGSNGVLTLGITHQDAKQRSPMWGSLTLVYADGRQADFPASSSTSQDWTYWNVESSNAFVEYTHALTPDWEARLTYNLRRAKEDVRLLYAFPFTAGLNNDNTGLFGWPYSARTSTDNRLFDASVNGRFDAFGRSHTLIAGISRSHQESATDTLDYDTTKYQYQALPAFPYPGNAYTEPVWGASSPASGGEQTLTRFYAATRLALTDQLKAIVGVNAIKLERAGSSRYGSVSPNDPVYPATKETSPYVGLTYDITPDMLAYVSHSDIFQNQDQKGADLKTYLAPMKGVNQELGVKAEWLDKQLLTTLAVFRAEQHGLAFRVGTKQDENNQPVDYYEGRDVKSKGIEVEATGRISQDTRLTLGATRLSVKGPNGADTYEWIPRTTVNFRADTRLPALPALKLGIGGRWQSDISKTAGARQDAYLVANAFAAYDINDRTTVRFNVNNLFNKKAVQGLAYGAIYNAPRNYAVSLNYQL
ncbi:MULTISPECIES: TonB-dependent siderophore receptor [unclassified Roseateles]|uniref:TonB-dependent siderophore receptor n=1 Tax=unclassified Roseateles TaxID=2626991 RepID=UPI0006F46176|nr:MULTISPECIES: TonB-dependent siderophore receptor [unclassified Roseateles]KQW43239.1 TonB-dependent receptor [Pelomonas sp. Root405]KRA70977.1 TonB-dependent receptor [Pelomonas sp. Root662]